MLSRDLNLPVGSSLLVEKKDSGDRFLVELIGYLIGKGIMITPAFGQGDAMALAQGDYVTVRYLGGANKLSFQSRIIHISKKPYPYLHLAYPLGENGRFSRQTTRLPVRGEGPEINLLLSDQGQQLSVCMVDVSMAGARLVASKSLAEVGAQLVIEIPNAVAGERLSLSCVVRHVSCEGEGASVRYFHGVEFNNVDDSIFAYLNHLLMRNL